MTDVLILDTLNSQGKIVLTGKLTDRWRPRDFAGVIGQPGPVNWCRERLAKKEPQSAIFCGPSGCGKNSVARYYARCLACTSPTPIGLACGRCDACGQPMDGTQNGFYVEVPGAEIRTKAGFLEYLESLRHAPWQGARRILVIDEANDIMPRLQGSLKRVLEKLQTDFVIIILTTDFDALIPEIQARASKQQFKLVSNEDLVAYGKAVCASESIKFNPAAIELLADASKGQVRDFLQNIDDVFSLAGVVSEEGARQHLGVDVGVAVTVLASLLSGDLATAVDVRLQHDGAMRIANLVQQLIVAVEYRLRRIEPTNDAFRMVAPAKIDELQKAVRQVAERQRVNQLQLWAELREIWRKATVKSRRDLEAVLLDCHSWFHELPHQYRKGRQGNAYSLVSLGKSASSVRPHRRAKGLTGRDNSLEQVKRVWDSVSLMSQVYGVYLNSRITIRPGLLGFNDDANAQGFIGYLIRSLVGRIYEWSGRDVPVHWAYTQTGVGFRSVYTVALALPPDMPQAASDWLFEKFFPARFDDLPPVGATFHWAAMPSVVAQAQYQARLLRLLCRGVNPALTVCASGKKDLLVDAIGVPRRLWAAAAGAGLMKSYVSKTIGRSEARKWKELGLPVLTPGHDGAWEYDNPGWELAEHRDRQDELARRANQQGASSQSLRVLADRSRAGRLLNGPSYELDARDRFRSWPTPERPGWWQPACVPLGRLAR